MTNTRTQATFAQQSAGQHTIPLSAKDLSYINDLMKWELVAAKKAYQYACQTTEPECRQVMMDAAKQHQQNCERIALHLGQHASQVVQASIGAGATVTAAHSIPM